MRTWIVYWLLRALRRLCRLFYRYDWQWVGEVPEVDPWSLDYHLVAILNHTSLYEVLFVGNVPVQFLRRIARHGLVPVADKTMERPLVGFFFRLIAANVVSITRARDRTWQRLLDAIEPQSLVVILPEGRMKRENGLDSYGRPMVVRPGVADILETIGDGRLLVAYSLGLHHIQVPGQRFPRLFRTVRLRLESLDIADYRRRMLERGGRAGFREAVVADLTARRDRYCREASAEEPAAASIAR